MQSAGLLAEPPSVCHLDAPRPNQKLSARCLLGCWSPLDSARVDSRLAGTPHFQGPWASPHGRFKMAKVYCLIFLRGWADVRSPTFPLFEESRGDMVNFSSCNCPGGGNTALEQRPEMQFGGILDKKNVSNTWRKVPRENLIFLGFLSLGVAIKDAKQEEPWTLLIQGGEGIELEGQVRPPQQ